MLTKIISSFKGNNLKARCVHSSIALGIGTFFAKFLGFGSKVVLTRLLAPQEMGLMVMILSLTRLFEVLTEIGIKQSVIQHKNGGDPEYLNMAWWFQGLRAVGLYAVAFIAAPWLCEFYFRSKPEVLIQYSMGEITILIRVAFLAILFNGFVSPKSYVLEKMFKFNKALIITQGSLVLGSIITIILAFVIKNVWAMVIGFAATGFARCMISYILCPFLPQFAYHRESFQGLYGFAKGMFGLPILTYIAFNVDVLITGKLISTSLIGFYGMALTLALAPWDLFAGIINPVLLPAFAEKQNDNKILCKAVLQIAGYTALFATPLTALALSCSGTILALVYGAGYSSVAVPFGLLCVYVVLLMQGSVFSSLFFGIGQPGKHRVFVAVRCFVLVALIYPGIKFFGLTGAAAAVLLASFTALCLQFIVIHKTIGLNVFDYIISWVPGLILSIAVFAVIAVARTLNPGSPKMNLTIGALACLVFCGLGLLLRGSFCGRRLETSRCS